MEHASGRQQQEGTTDQFIGRHEVKTAGKGEQHQAHQYGPASPKSVGDATRERPEDQKRHRPKRNQHRGLRGVESEL